MRVARRTLEMLALALAMMIASGCASFRVPAIDPSGDLMWLEVLALAQIGDKDQAFAVMGRFYAAHPEQRAFAARDETWWLEGLKDDPRYRRLVGAS